MQAIASIMQGAEPAKKMSRPAVRAITGFHHLHQRMLEVHRSETTTQLLEEILSITGLTEHVKARDNGAERWENVLELLDLTRQFGRSAAPDGLTALMDHITLMDQTETEDDQNRPQLTLSTLHKAKGLEFPHVAVIGVQEGLLPHANTENIQEERRLLYVGMTRAKDTLILSHEHSENRERSRFLDEITTVTTARTPPELERSRT